MKPSSLHALIIDRHLGELSPEACELLELHLMHHEAARAEAERIVQSLAATHDAVLRHPELARVPSMEKPAATARKRPALTPWLARAAVLLLLGVITGAAGFIAGRSVTQTKTIAVVAHHSAAPQKQSPWAQYRMTFDPSGHGMKVVRVGRDIERSVP